jgi:hypothetical protein
MLSLRRKLLEQGTTDASAFYETHLRCKVEGWRDLCAEGFLGPRKVE